MLTGGVGGWRGRGPNAAGMRGVMRRVGGGAGLGGGHTAGLGQQTPPVHSNPPTFHMTLFEVG